MKMVSSRSVQLALVTPCVISHRHDIISPGHTVLAQSHIAQRSIPSVDIVETNNGIFGNCDEENSVVQCGFDYVCKHGQCAPCSADKECSDNMICLASGDEKLCVTRDLFSDWNWLHAFCSLFIIGTATLSAAAGTGGGSMYVPLLLLCVQLSAKEAVPLSQALILGGSFVNLMLFVGDAHPRFPEYPRIDYKVVMIMNPGLSAGVMLGVWANVICPQWLIITCLLVTLLVTFYATCKKASTIFESEFADAHVHGGSLELAGVTTGKEEITFSKSLHLKWKGYGNCRKFISKASRPLLCIWGCWLMFFMASVFKIDRCSPLWFVEKVGILAACVGFTYIGQDFIKEGADELPDVESETMWTIRKMKRYPLHALGVGILGGFLGVGGGIIMGPLLLELGLPAEAAQATTAMFVFLSASLATMQFLAVGSILPGYVLWFTCLVGISTLVGQTILDYWSKKIER
jgi:uncharacterized membrane protein YfcA